MIYTDWKEGDITELRNALYELAWELKMEILWFLLTENEWEKKNTNWKYCSFNGCPRLCSDMQNAVATLALDKWCHFDHRQSASGLTSYAALKTSSLCICQCLSANFSQQCCEQLWTQCGKPHKTSFSQCKSMKSECTISLHVHPGLSTLTHWAWVSRLDIISHALMPSMLNLPHECETSRQAYTCRISRIMENITFFFFACHFFLKLKPIHNSTAADAKRTAKYHYFFSCFGSSRRAILKSWQPW